MFLLFLFWTVAGTIAIPFIFDAPIEWKDWKVRYKSKRKRFFLLFMGGFIIWFVVGITALMELYMNNVNYSIIQNVKNWFES